MQQGTKFIFTYKILHSNSECALIHNAFSFPEKGNGVVTPDGHLYFLGGYYPLIKHFSKNTFILDEHRNQLVPLQLMKQGRSDFATVYFKGNIFAFGGQSYSQAPNRPPNSLESLNTAEVYSIQKD